MFNLYVYIYTHGFLAPKTKFSGTINFFQNGCHGHFGFLAVLNFAHIFQSGMGAYFVRNTLKYHHNQPSNLVCQRLVTES